MIGCAVMFLILQGGATWLAGILDLMWAALIVTAIMLAVAVVWERLVFNLTLPEALRALSFGRPTARALLTAGIIVCIMLLFFPVFSFIADAPVRLHSDWPWILIGAIALNGIAEETLFHGFVFGAVHLLLFVHAPFVVAFLATLLALAAAFPMAYLFESGGNIMWAAVMLHVAAHTIRLVVIPEPYFLPAIAIWSVLQLGVPFLVFTFRRSLLKPSR